MGEAYLSVTHQAFAFYTEGRAVAGGSLHRLSHNTDLMQLFLTKPTSSGESNVTQRERDKASGTGWERSNPVPATPREDISLPRT